MKTKSDVRGHVKCLGNSSRQHIRVYHHTPHACLTASCDAVQCSAVQCERISRCGVVQCEHISHDAYTSTAPALLHVADAHLQSSDFSRQHFTRDMDASSDEKVQYHSFFHFLAFSAFIGPNDGAR